ncbi:MULTISPECIES: hypothetical protein [Enterococcus]|uniref:Uncharacterized protein n=1 Tax=Enterococcus malodoratus ATCC 43197 TaxID=1158601 RepID=R2RDA8_9ENTE|nr:MULTISPECIES: hypothetical protein [Enterococcus]EOH81670.1 hypothetical protein UAI_00278 [Enterococcus malodoratus ATCC 43197]EOT68752.1 hypothetical protein I585_00210 [Enterococcus malodoratus ATCC 43197]OJG64822.1 hypothetical protein RV07_GL003775 [Enterococcus malodoratus]SPW86555.1 Uncharacterised protein [Enterococcus malodoratus]STC71891.1 Uncharacterised protein [Enterococcus malodoratus]
MERYLATAKEKILNFWRNFIIVVSENERRTLAILAGLVIFAIIFSTSAAFAQKTIRQDQLDELVFDSLKSDHLIPLEYQTVDQKIKDTKAISIMFSQPDGTSFRNVMTVLDDPNQQTMLNRKFYYYPIVYDSETIAQKYKLDPRQVTFIFFHNGKEKNRFVVESLADLNNEFIPELNRLPMWDLKK